MLVLLVTYFLKAFLYMANNMPHFSCCIPRSNRMRQDTHKMVKNQHKCFMNFHHGIDSISIDISMYRIEIIKIENISYREKILNNDIPTGGPIFLLQFRSLACEFSYV